MATLKEEFEKNGFVLVKSVLTKEEVKEFRALLYDKFSSAKDKKQIMHPYNEREIYKYAFKDKIIAALHEAIGEDLYYLPTASVNRNSFGTWHYDANANVQSYLFEDNFKLVKCGIYLQDNTSEWGGGVQVVKKDDFKLYYKRDVFEEGLKNGTYEPIFVPIEEGDFLFFDYRLWHNATFPNEENRKNLIETKDTCLVKNIPEEFSKLIYYWDSGNYGTQKNYMNGLKKRAIKEEYDGIHAPYFTMGLSKVFPNDYDEGFIKLAKEKNISIASLTIEESKPFKSILKRYSLL